MTYKGVVLADKAIHSCQLRFVIIILPLRFFQETVVFGNKQVVRVKSILEPGCVDKSPQAHLSLVGLDVAFIALQLGLQIL